MKERPILFSGPLVRAILAGEKTETRRLVRRPARCSTASFADAMLKADQEGWPGVMKTGPEDGLVWAIRPPYGAAGDVLWVRESWATAASLDDLSPSAIGQKAIDAGYSQPWAPVWWMADGGYNNAVSRLGAEDEWGGCGRWRPSIHMPRWACRLRLVVTETRIEPLHAIDDAGALREGVDRTNTSIPGYARTRFERLWDSINGKRPGAAWEHNPWVWVIRFEVLR